MIAMWPSLPQGLVVPHGFESYPHPTVRSLEIDTL